MVIRKKRYQPEKRRTWRFDVFYGFNRRLRRFMPTILCAKDATVPRLAGTWRRETVPALRFFIHCGFFELDGVADGNEVVGVEAVGVESDVVVLPAEAALDKVDPRSARTGRAVWLGPGTGIFVYESWKISFCAPSRKL